MEEAKKQKPKKGRVVRISERAHDLLVARERTVIKAVDSVLDENHDLQVAIESLASVAGGSAAKVYYALPSDLFEHVEDARGRAVVKSVQTGKKKAPERPIEVRGSGK